MTPLLIILTALIHLAAASLLMKHRRNVRHHRASMPVIGRDPSLTEMLHARLCDRNPTTDWLNPTVMRAKCQPWLRHD